MTPDGHVFKLKLVDGLLYLPLEYPTDEEFDTLPHVVFTSPGVWNPDDIKDDEDDLAWFNAVEDPDALDDAEFYDAIGGAVPGDGEAAEMDAYMALMNPRNTRCCPRNYEQFLKFFAWKPIAVIHDTFAATTQYAKQALRLPLRRHFKSRFPALNVQRLDEVVATDTFFAYCAAHDGSTCSQLFVGKTSYFTTCMGMTTDAEFPGALMDFIQSFGAMSGLFSDNAKA